MPSYKTDKDLESLATILIKKHRPKLVNVAICYMFRDEAALDRQSEKVIAGQCTRTDDRNYTIHEFDFVIEVARDIWEDATDQFRTALMDHELGHVGIRFDENDEVMRDPRTDRVRTFIRKHSVEEFEEILERYGDWHKELRDFLAAWARRRMKRDEEDDDVDL